MDILDNIILDVFPAYVEIEGQDIFEIWYGKDMYNNTVIVEIFNDKVECTIW